MGYQLIIRLVDAISKWTKAKLATLEIWHSVFPGVDPQKRKRLP